MNKCTEQTGRNCQSGIAAALKRQDLLLRVILMDIETLNASLDAANAKTEKIIGEIQALKDAMANAAVTLPPEVEAKVNQLIGNLQVADDLNADPAV